MLARIPESMRRVVRFLISGSISTGSTLAAVYIANSVLGIWYIVASVIGFFTGFFVGFLLHKFWTFKDHRSDKGIVGQQLTRYVIVVAFNLALNTLFVYCFVEYAHFIPVLAQACASLLIACESFFAYRYFIFTSQEEMAQELT